VDVKSHTQSSVWVRGTEISPQFLRFHQGFLCAKVERFGLLHCFFQALKCSDSILRAHGNDFLGFIS